MSQVFPGFVILILIVLPLTLLLTALGVVRARCRAAGGRGHWPAAAAIAAVVVAFLLSASIVAPYAFPDRRQSFHYYATLEPSGSSNLLVRVSLPVPADGRLWSSFTGSPGTTQATVNVTAPDPSLDVLLVTRSTVLASARSDEKGWSREARELTHLGDPATCGGPSREGCAIIGVEVLRGNLTAIVIYLSIGYGGGCGGEHHRVGIGRLQRSRGHHRRRLR